MRKSSKQKRRKRRASSSIFTNIRPWEETARNILGILRKRGATIHPSLISLVRGMVRFLYETCPYEISPEIDPHFISTLEKIEFVDGPHSINSTLSGILSEILSGEQACILSLGEPVLFGEVGVKKKSITITFTNTVSGCIEIGVFSSGGRIWKKLMGTPVAIMIYEGDYDGGIIDCLDRMCYVFSRGRNITILPLPRYLVKPFRNLAVGSIGKLLAFCPKLKMAALSFVNVGISHKLMMGGIVEKLDYLSSMLAHIITLLAMRESTISDLREWLIKFLSTGILATPSYRSLEDIVDSLISRLFREEIIEMIDEKVKLCGLLCETASSIYDEIRFRLSTM